MENLVIIVKLYESHQYSFIKKTKTSKRIVIIVDINKICNNREICWMK